MLNDYKEIENTSTSCELICTFVFSVVMLVLLIFTLIEGYPIYNYYGCHTVYIMMIYLCVIMSITVVYLSLIISRVELNYDLHKILYGMMLVSMFVWGVVNSNYINVDSPCGLYMDTKHPIFYYAVLSYYVFSSTLFVIGLLMFIVNILKYR